MFKGDCFDVLLNTTADRAVTPRIDTSQVGNNVCEESLDLVVACLVFFGDLRGNR